MQEVAVVSILLILSIVAALAWSFVKRPLETSIAYAEPLPNARPPADMRLYALQSGTMSSRAALAYRGGGFSDYRDFSIGAILIRHPAGNLLFDAGFGAHVDEHFLTTPWLMQQTAEYRQTGTVAAMLTEAGFAADNLKGVILTHAHWDHVSGLEHFSQVPVWVTQAELDFIQGGHRSTELARQLGLQNYQTYDFPDGAYLGFAESLDVYQDGSVVLVPAGSHTPGSIIAFITLPTERRYALVGDIVWQAEGIEIPAEKPWISRRIADNNADATRSLIKKLHSLRQAFPSLTFVPAHDARVWAQLPRL